MTGTNRAFELAAYGGWNLGALHVTGQLGYVFGHLSATKNLVIGTATSTAAAAAGEHLLKATGTAGFLLKAAGMQLEPFVGIDFSTGRISGFTETGAGAASLTVAPISARQTDLLAGANLTRSSGQFRPYVRAVYRSAIGGLAGDTVTASFNGDQATAFSVVGTAPARHEFDADAGVNFVFDDAGSLFVGYQGTMRSGLSAHGINAGVRIEF